MNNNSIDKAEQEYMRLYLPLYGGETVWVYIKPPISEKNWAHLMKVLETMKPGLVEEIAKND